MFIKKYNEFLLEVRDKKYKAAGDKAEKDHKDDNHTGVDKELEKEINDELEQVAVHRLRDLHLVQWHALVWVQHPVDLPPSRRLVVGDRGKRSATGRGDGFGGKLPLEAVSVVFVRVARLGLGLGQRQQ